jgi:murein DD-endopeptidase MepM/ murein hydrolase activator NlpD
LKMMKVKSILKPKTWITLLMSLALGIAAIAPGAVVAAQESQPDGPVYIVVPGDTMWGISRVFNVSLDDLAALNGISDPSQLAVGARLVIPGMSGLSGLLAIGTVPYGENFRSLSRRYQIPYEVMARLNRYTSPDQVAAGATLITVIPEGSDVVEPVGGRATLRTGKSLFEMAVAQNMNPWTLAAENGIRSSWEPLPGEVLYVSGSGAAGPGALPEAIRAVEITPFPATQGKTTLFRVRSEPLLSLQGSLADWQLNFFEDGDDMVALQGVHALFEPGYYRSSLSGQLGDGTPFDFSQRVYIQDGNYPFDPPLVVDSETLDVENTKPEDLEWLTIVEPVSPDKMWQGIFDAPVPEYLRECYPSTFGNRRSYNGSAYQYFHTGLDFCGTVGVEVYAPAAGVVVYTGELIVRGNSTVIDHGWGVYTAYAHQSEILVAGGDRVARGQLIGLVGETGRVTGPHLHWEVIVGGVQVDPMDWLANPYP